MAQIQENNKLFPYLLGTMGEAEKEKLENAFFADDEQFGLLLSAEDDLIDAYVRGSLPATDRKAFELNFLTTPERVERVQFARSLYSHVQAHPPKVEAKLPWWKAFFSLSPTGQLAIAAVTLVVAMFVAQVLRVQQPAPPVEQAHVEGTPATQPATQAPSELPAPAKEAPAPSILAFVLTPGLTRDASGAKILQIPEVTRSVQLQLNLENADYSRYEVMVQTPEGEDVWKQSGLRSKSIRGAKALVVDVPAAKLLPRDYVVRVSGLNDGGAQEDVAEYAFRTARR